MSACEVCKAEVPAGAVVCPGCGAVSEPAKPDSQQAAASAPATEPTPAAVGAPAETPAPTEVPTAAPTPPPTPTDPAPVAAPRPVAPFPQPGPRSGRRVFRPAWLFGIAAVLMGCAAILWVILHFSPGGGAQAAGGSKGSREGRDAAARLDKETVTGTWGVPWGGAAPEVPDGTRVDPETLPSRGSNDPVLALVEFGDYECEFTQKAERTLDRLMARFGDDVRLVYVHDPLAIHDHALLAAEAAEAARLQGKFGEMHQRLLAAKGDVAREDVVRMARDIGLDVARFQRDLDGTAKDRVAAMVAFTRARGITGTPHFVIGGRVIEGARSEEIFVRVIEAALEEAKARIGALHSREEVFRESMAFLSGA
jgi:2-hydroxychromene-2-carboxylate isomerase